MVARAWLAHLFFRSMPTASAEGRGGSRGADIGTCWRMRTIGHISTSHRPHIDQSSATYRPVIGRRRPAVRDNRYKTISRALDEGGSLVGALRPPHKFIPWDSDADVTMVDSTWNEASHTIPFIPTHVRKYVRTHVRTRVCARVRAHVRAHVVTYIHACTHVYALVLYNVSSYVRPHQRW